MIRRLCYAATICSLLIACDPNAGKVDVATTTFDGNKKLIVAAAYCTGCQSDNIAAWADVPVGTAATLEMTGPLHMYCAGTFVAQTDTTGMPGPGGNRPGFDFGGGPSGATFAAPAGLYTVVVSIPSLAVRVTKGFRARDAYNDPLTHVWDLPVACVPVADTRQQLADLTAAHVQAVSYWVGTMPPSSIRSQLDALAAKAHAEVLAGDKQAARDTLISIRDAVKPLIAHGPYYDIYRDANASIALLNQPSPAA